MDRSQEPTLHTLSIGIDRGTDDGRYVALVIGSDQFRMAAKVLHARAPAATAPCYMLVFHAVELILKAWLAKKGMSDKDMRRQFGHNLVALYGEAGKRDLILTIEDERGLLEWANEYHDVPDGVRVRYDFFEAELPLVERYFRILDRLRHSRDCKLPTREYDGRSG